MESCQEFTRTLAGASGQRKWCAEVVGTCRYFYRLSGPEDCPTCAEGHDSVLIYDIRIYKYIRYVMKHDKYRTCLGRITDSP